MPQRFRLKSGQNEEISHANHIPQWCFQGTFWHHGINLQNSTKISLKLHKLWEISKLYTRNKFYKSISYTM